MSDEGERTCPLCAEEMDLTDQQLKPCKCGYEICVWCWHHILNMAEKDESEGRCPACRSPYDKEKIVGMAANCDRLVTDSMDRKKSQKAKTKPSEGRKQLSSVRVIQRNLVYIVGLPLDLADEDLLQRKEYFGQYGKVLKVSMSRTAAGVIQQFPNNTCSVYITYSKEEEAIRCIQSVHGFVLDGRSLKACFGTTKYCHAWLRNVPCSNPDCLYLHEIGSHEDSFTKDEIISAYTRSRVQLTVGTNNMARRSGNVLPPPIDDYCISNSASAAKPIGKNTSNNTISNGRSSPPNGSSGRSIALPPAASWAMRASCQSQSTSSICSNGSIKSKPDNTGVTSAFSPVLESRTQASMLHNNVEKESTQDEVSQNYNCKDKPDLVKPVRQITGADSQAILPDKHSIDDATTTVNLNDQSFFPPSKDIDSGSNVVPNVSNTIVQGRHSHFPEEKRSSSIDAKVQNLDFSSSRFDNVRSELPCISRTISSLSDQVMIKSPSSEMTLRPYLEQCSEPMASPVVEESVAARSMLCSSGENFDWETNSQAQGIAVSKVQDNIMSFDNQTFEDSESVGHSSSLPHSANLLHLPNHSRSHSLQRNELFSAGLNSDPIYGDNRVSSHMLQHAPGNSVKSNGYYENLASNFPGVDRSTNHAIWHSNEGEGKHMKTDYCSNGTLDVGESSIISNILSLDLDSWDDSLASPQNLVNLLGDTDKQHSTLKMSSSWKPQNNSQSRFSFARHGESRSQASDDPTFGVFGQLQKTSSFSHDFGDNRNSYFDKPALGNGFSSRLQEPEIYSPNTSAFLSNRSSAVPRAQISAPPGFSVPNRAPPPGFSSHERMDQTFDNFAGNHMPDSSFLLRNSFQPQPSGNVGTTDIEFMDPAILAVGKGRLQAGLNNPVIDMRSQSHFPQQLSALENEARFQLLMQRSLSAHQNLRYTDVGDRFSSISDSYGLSSRLVDQSPVNNLNSFSQLSLQQQSRNGLVSNGQWDGWNEVQGGNNLGMADLIRNERLGFNKFYASGYEDSKFRMPTSSDLYNRTFEM